VVINSPKNNPKMRTLFLFSLLVNSLYLFSQNIYFEPYYSKSFAVEKSDFTFVSSNTTFYYDDSVNSDYHTVTYHKSLGAGNNYGLLIGYKFPKGIISTEIDFRYFSNNVLTFNSQDYYDFPEEPNYHIEYNDTYNLRSTSFSITPSLKVEVYYKRWGLFLKSGLLFAKCSIDYEVETSIFNTHPSYYPFESYSEIIEYKPKWELGIQGAIGVEYQLDSWIVLNVGIQYNAFGHRPESATMTEYKYRGEDKLNSLTISEKEFIFSDSYMSADNASEDKPTVMERLTYTYSSMAIRFGVQIIIPNKKVKEGE